jgi:hypothetical protein
MINICSSKKGGAGMKTFPPGTIVLYVGDKKMIASMLVALGAVKSVKPVHLFRWAGF